MVNPAAGSGRGSTDADRVVAEYRSRGVEVRLHEPATRLDAVELLARLRATAPERLVVRGGDGMMQLAVQSFAGSDTTLGLLAGGTGNDFVTGLGLPTRLADAIAATLGPGTRIDLLRSGDQRAASVVTAGFAVDVNERADALRWPRGGQRYTVAALRQLPVLTTTCYDLCIDGVTRRVDANLLAVANTPMFGGGMRIAPDADCADGLLDLVIIGPASRATFAMVLPAVFSGHHVRHPSVEVIRAASVEVSSMGTAVPLRADGEVFGDVDAATTRIVVDRAAVCVAGIQQGPTMEKDAHDVPV